MEIAPIRVPKMRRNKNFIVEQNVDAISVAISIPNKRYAEQFARINGMPT